jgi:glycosyltransferase involved in cell wall biosynthesis
MAESARTLFINGRFLTHSTFSGVQRFATEIVKAIDRIIVDKPRTFRFDDYVMLVPNAAHANFLLCKVRTVRVGRLAGHAWEQLDLPLAARAGWLLNLCNSGPIAKRRQAVVIHDAAVFAMPANFSRGYRAAYTTMLPILTRRAAVLFTVSNFSRNELAAWLKVDKCKFQVVYEGADHMRVIEPDASILRKNSLTPGTFFLAVGADSRNKNFGQICRALEKSSLSEFKLVVTGRRDGSVHYGLDDTVRQHIVRVGLVTDAQLKALYEAALALIYPSTYEGFGLPPVEAMVCGCPVIAGNRASLPEICGGGAIICDSLNEDALASRMRDIAMNVALRDTARRRGFAHARAFRWDTAADRVVSCIGEIA